MLRGIYFKLAMVIAVGLLNSSFGTGNLCNSTLYHLSSLNELHERFTNPPFISRDQQQAFWDGYRTNSERIAVTIEFPIIRQLQQLLRNKTTPTRIFNLYRTIVMDRLLRDDFLNGHLLRLGGGEPTISGDYNQFSLVFRRDSEVTSRRVRERLELLQRDSLNAFSESVSEIPEIRDLEASSRALIANRLSWFSWGIGNRPIEAFAVSHAGRFHPILSGEIPHIRDFNSSADQERLIENFYNAESDRRFIEYHLLPLQRVGRPQLLLQIKNGTAWVPSLRFWEILRDIQAPDRASYFREVQARVQREFGIEIPGILVSALQSYSGGSVDSLMPQIRHWSQSSDLGVQNAPFGFVYIDVRGQGSRNRSRVAEELARLAEHIGTSEVSLMRVLNDLRNVQRSESRRFSRAVTRISRVNETYLRGARRVSGDELNFLLSNSHTEQEFLAHLQAVADLETPVRVMIVSGGTPPTTQHHLEAAVRVERTTRETLANSSQISGEDLQKMVIAVHLSPTSEIAGDTRIFIAGPASIERQVNLARRVVSFRQSSTSGDVVIDQER